jgi:transaldolase
MRTRLHQLQQLGQSPWIDVVTRDFVRSGQLQQLVERGIRGLTANPTIFHKAVASSSAYDASIADLAVAGADASRIYEALIVDDIRAAADVLRPLYDQTKGADGFASIEVSPKLASDTQATIAEARMYAQAINRPNVFVKVPATEAGIPAIEQLIGEGININITLIFGIEYYEQVMEAYLAGLERLAAAGQPLDRVASVASFFVSRVDTEVDKRLDALKVAAQDDAHRRALDTLVGKAAIANARLAYQRFQTTFGSARFAALKARGARVQRPLWASTSTKNPRYRDVLYVEELIGPDTVNTMPLATVAAFEDHGRVARTIDTDVGGADAAMQTLQDVGIAIKDVTDTLQVEGVRLFTAALENLYACIEEKRATLLAADGEPSVRAPARPG